MRPIRPPASAVFPLPRGTRSESVRVGARYGLLRGFCDLSSLPRCVGRWPPRNRSPAPATAVPCQTSDRRFPEPTTSVALFRSGFRANGHEALLQAWPECRADVRTDSEAVPRETKTQTCVRTILALDSWIPPIRSNRSLVIHYPEARLMTTLPNGLLPSSSRAASTSPKLKTL